ncbi:UpxY family transcription antiterminator [Bacteroides sp.]|uniref:UpxY family transcription antiterminator n=1 Tax=Bacteroides sp. TaxID=29523 RepID=UPI003AB79DAA
MDNQKKYTTWYVLRTYNRQELKISEYLSELGKEHFIPMTYVERKGRDGKVKRVLTPVVHNMIFLRKDEPQKLMLDMLEGCTVPLSVLRKENSTECYEIPENQMTEFRSLCDPSFEGTHFMTHEEAEAKPGKEVRIVHGPLAGMTGKLHRVKNSFFFIKTLAGLGVMIRISRWYCEVIE